MMMIIWRSHTDHHHLHVEQSSLAQCSVNSGTDIICKAVRRDFLGWKKVIAVEDKFQWEKWSILEEGEAGWVGSDSIKEAKIEEMGGISDTALSTTQDWIWKFLRDF